MRISVVLLLLCAAMISTSGEGGSASPPGAVDGDENDGVDVSDPARCWANTYLINTVFALEFLAVNDQAAATPDGHGKFLASEAARNLWHRAAFAAADAAKRSQRLEDEERLRELLAAQSAAGRHAAAVKNEVLLSGVTKSFAGRTFRDHWLALQKAYQTTLPSCAIDFADVKRFTEHQKTIAAGNKPVNVQQLVQPIAGWDLSRIRCLLFTLVTAPEKVKKEQGYEPLHLIRAMQQTSSPYGGDATVRTVLAVRLLQVGDYAETLRTLVELQDAEASLRLAYEIVQRVYSIKQKGQGAVTLREL